MSTEDDDDSVKYRYHGADVILTVKFPGPSGWLEHQYEFEHAEVVLKNRPARQYTTFNVTIDGQIPPPSVHDLLEWNRVFEEAVIAMEERDVQDG